MKPNYSKALVLITASVFMFASCGKKTQETKPIRKDVTETVFASGVLEANGSYNLTAQNDGYLVQVNFKEGDVVKEGMVLAVVDNKENKFNTESSTALFNIAQSNLQPNAPALVQAKNTVQVAKQNLRQDSTQWMRYKKLYESNSVAKVDLENAELKYQSSVASYQSAIESYKLQKQQAEQAVITNRAQKEVSRLSLGNNEIRAVVTGKVYSKSKQKGDFVRKGDVIALIGDANFIYAKVNIDETNISKVKVGQEAMVKLNIDKSKVYKGSVSEILPSFDENAQSFTCKIVFSEPLAFSIVNTQLQSNIVTSVNKNALIIPRNYLDFGGYVHVKGQNEPVKIETKFVSNEWVQVLSGIDENTILVTDNIIENKMTTSEVGSQMH